MVELKIVIGGATDDDYKFYNTYNNITIKYWFTII